MTQAEKLKNLIDDSIFLTEEGKESIINNIKNKKYTDKEIEFLIEYFETTNNKLKLIKEKHISKISEQFKKIKKIITKIEDEETKIINTMNKDELYQKAVKIKNIENELIKNKNKIYEVKRLLKDKKDIGNMDNLIENI